MRERAFVRTSQALGEKVQGVIDMYQCAKCQKHGCMHHDSTQVMKECPGKALEIQEEAKALYLLSENHKMARQAAILESEGYGVYTRIEEIVRFSKKMGYRRVGLLFCLGLAYEARIVEKILAHHGLEVVSCICKNGAIPKSFLGLRDDQVKSGCADEVMCNPIGQALLMNQSEVQLNILLGLCVGHDTLALKYLEAPATVLAVKDRVTGHNPLAAVYLAEGYYKKRLLGDPITEALHKENPPIAMSSKLETL